MNKSHKKAISKAMTGHYVSEETKQKISKALTTHGMINTSFYRSWGGMLQRCNNPNLPYYKDYGGRGITVCERWLKFENFKEDMLPTYEDGLMIDRIDNDGGYSKENCRWATFEQQQRNTRRTKYVTYKGETMCVTEWAHKLKIPPPVLTQRLNNWQDIENAMTYPYVPHPRKEEISKLKK